MSNKFFIRFISLILILFALMLLVNELGLFKETYKTYVAKIDTLTSEQSVDAFVFRREYLLASSQAGNVRFLVEDGERVPKGTPVAAVGIAGEGSYQAWEIPSNLQINYDDIKLQYDNKQDELAYLVNDNKLDEVEQVKAKLSQLAAVKLAWEKQQGLVPNPVVVSSSQQSGEIFLNAPHAGIVSYQMLPEDPLFTPENLYIINYLNLKKSKEGQILREVQANQPFLRIVDNKASWLVFLVSEKDVKNYRVGRRIEAMISETRVRPIVENVIQVGEQYAVILKVVEDYPNFQNARYLNFKIVPRRLEGLVIKNTSLVEVEKQLGVYVLKKNYKKEFVPVMVIGSVGDKSVIYSDYFSVLESSGVTTRVKTVNLYDEIIEEP